MRIVTLLCGGSGTRLFPLSRPNYPKQYLNMNLFYNNNNNNNNKKLYNVDDDVDIDYADLSILQSIYLKSLHFHPDKFIFVVSKNHYGILIQQLTKIKIDVPHYIIIEPFGANTCPAICCACLLKDLNADDNMLVLSADHIWDNKFSIMIKNGMETLINYKESIITFGIKPTYPETGYGYIKYDNNYGLELGNSFDVLDFVEKPNSEKANYYFECGNYLWNSGTFLFKVGLMINEIQKYCPNIYNSCVDCINNINNNDVCGLFGFDANFICIPEEKFKNVTELSIDYGVMEYHKKGKVIIFDGYWTDIGSFASVYDLRFREKNLNNDDNIDNNNYDNNDVIDINNKILGLDINNTLIINNNPKVMVACYGLNNMVVVNSNDALLIIPKDKCQFVKNIVNHKDFSKIIGI